MVSLERAIVDTHVATFTATVPDGGMKTNRANEIVLTLHVSWKDRTEVYRILETIPMDIIVRVERVSGD